MPFALFPHQRESVGDPVMNTRSHAAAARRKVRWRWPGWPALTPSLLTLGIAAILLVLGLANIVIRATAHEADDGVLWVNRVEGVTAFEVAPGTPAARAGIKPGDLLEAVNGQLVDRSADVWDILHQSKEGQPVEYRVLRLGTSEAFSFLLSSVPLGNVSLYFVL